MQVGNELCRVLPAIHCLTGCDYTSKFGTKIAALKANSVEFLKDFGQILPEDDFSKMMRDAENYLVKVLSKNSQETTMDGLRRWQYRHQKNLNIEELPVTSVSIIPHILRAYFVCNSMISILNKNASPLKAVDYGYHIEDSLLVPSKTQNLLPHKYSVICSCGKCATRLCKCKLQFQRCTKFCECEASDRCKNEIEQISPLCTLQIDRIKNVFYIYI